MSCDTACVYSVLHYYEYFHPQFCHLHTPYFYLLFLLQTCIILQYSLPTLSEEYYIWVLPYITPYTLPIIHISLTGTTPLYSVERYPVTPFYRQCLQCGGRGC